MPTLTSERGINPIKRRLYLPAYRVGDAARYAKTASQTVASWHYRDSSRGPALPTTRTPGTPLSYLELIEVAFVSFFRKAGFTMKKIRDAREYLAQNFNSEYPFVEYRFKTEGYHLLLNLSQFERGDNMKRLVVADSRGQLGWQEVMADKFAEFDYEKLDGENLALKWHPAGRQSRVVIDPRMSFGAPTIGGIPTWVLKGRWTAGESLQDIVEDFCISEAFIRDGLDFEGIELAA